MGSGVTIMTKALMVKIRDVIVKSKKPLTYKEVADAVGIEKRFINKTLLQRIFGITDFPADKIKVGMHDNKPANPVFSTRKNITIQPNMLKDVDIPVGMRFEVECSTDKQGVIRIVLTSQGVDEEYKEKFERRYR